MWVVPKIGPQDTQQNSSLDRFFDEQPKPVALVRESIQNSMDASLGVEEPVKVCFSFNAVESEDLKPFFEAQNGNLIEHLKTCGISEKTGAIRTLTIEDFNTEGLTGETDNTKVVDEANNPVAGNFIGFWWSEGQSSKRRGSGGSHGVGKVKLSTSSDYKCFFGLTIRHDDQKELLIGYSQLKVHILNQQRYRSYARFGKLADKSAPDGKLDPYDTGQGDDKTYVERFKRAFGLQRESETGLSIIIPAINEEIKDTDILKAVITEFYLPILKDKLIVEVRNCGETTTVNSETISELTKHNLSSKESELLLAAQKMLLLNQKGCYRLEAELTDDPSRSLQTSDFNATTLTEMQNAFSEGQMVGVRIPATLYPRPASPNESSKPITRLFSIFIQTDEDSPLQKHSAYLRDNLLIRKEGSPLSKPYSVAFTYVEDEQLSEFLKHAEDPGHEKWTIRAIREKGFYKKESETLNSIKNRISELYNILEGLDEDEEITKVSPEIFTITEPTMGNSTGDNTRPDVNPIKARSGAIFNIVRKKGGFRIQNAKFLDAIIKEHDLSLPFKCRVQLGYKKPTGNSIKGYSLFDFQIQETETFTLDFSNITVEERRNNYLAFEVEHSTFHIEITGFDPNRDLEIRCEALAKGDS